MRRLRCDMFQTCEAEVSYIDVKGFIYCKEHGILRKATSTRSRELNRCELNLLEQGKPISYKRVKE